MSGSREREKHISRMPWHDRRGRIPSRAIQGFVKRVAARYKPMRIILFGSYARGDFTADSDVDLLVITQKRRRRDLRLRIRRHVDCAFPLDMIVIDESRLKRRIELDDFFLRDAVAEGRVVYEEHDQGMGQESRRG